MRKIKKRLKNVVGSIKKVGPKVAEYADTAALVLSRGFAVLVIVAAVGIAVSMLSQKTYTLRVLTNVGPTIVSLGQFLVRDISHEADGSLCFVLVENGKHSCVKLSLYDLVETEIQ